MDKDRVKGKAKDIAGRVERQVGEWTGDEEKQIEGTKKQVRGKVQNAWGKMKDAGKKAAKSPKSVIPRLPGLGASAM
jgi:uncharacterized protein YjbJ (UPF0337 family)